MSCPRRADHIERAGWNRALRIAKRDSPHGRGDSHTTNRCLGDEVNSLSSYLVILPSHLRENDRLKEWPQLGPVRTPESKDVSLSSEARLAVANAAEEREHLSHEKYRQSIFCWEFCADEVAPQNF